MTDAAVATRSLLRQSLTTIRGVWEETLDPPRQPGNGGSTGKPESRLPISASALESRAMAEGVLASWCGLVGDERGVCPVSLGEGQAPDLASWLDEHVDWLAGQETGPIAALELDVVAKDLDHIAHPSWPESLYIGQCPVGVHVGVPCGERLYWPAGAETTTCPACGTSDDVRGWVKRMGDELPDELTAMQLSTYLSRKFHREIGHDLIRKWASRKTLVSVGRDERRRPLYSAHAAVVACQAHLDKAQRLPRRVVA